MPIRYRYDANQPWIVVQGDRWESNPVPASCFGANIQPGVIIDAVIGGYGSNGGLILTPANQQLGHGGGLGTTFDRLRVDRTFIAAVFKKSNGQETTSGTAWNTKYGGVGTSRHWHSATVVGNFFYYYPNIGTFPSGGVLIDPATFQNTPQNYCTTAGCNFKVFLGQQETLNITQPTCPIAELAPDQCPPNTCEVDCGSYVCCYGSDGISVFNYNK